MDFSQITETLFIGSPPIWKHQSILWDLGVRLVINMRAERWPFPYKKRTPIHILWLPTIDSPLIPIPIYLLKKGVRTALETIQAGGKVYTHCAKGRHRGVAMGAAILIAQGYHAEEAIQLIKEHRKAADPDIWYIRERIHRFAEAWNNAYRFPTTGK